ncbi:hypothetical protein Dimus_020668 [Dionaea muscipula]
MGAAHVDLGEDVFIADILAPGVDVIHAAIHLEIGDHLCDTFIDDERMRLARRLERIGAFARDPGRVSASSASAAAVSSMRLLVVTGSAPDNSFSASPKRRIAAQPPGPGLGLQPPSVQISTTWRGFALPVSSDIGGDPRGMAVEAQLAQIFNRVFRRHQSAFRHIEPVVEAGQQEAHRRTLRQNRQRRDLGLRQGADGLIGRDERAALGHVKGAVGLETPGIKADGEVIGEDVGRGEIEVDEAGNLPVEEKDIVGKEIGMDLAARQVLRPVREDAVQRFREFGTEAGGDVVGAAEAAVQQGPPAGGPEGIDPLGRIAGAGLVQLGERLPKRRAMRLLQRGAARHRAGRW